MLKKMFDSIRKFDRDESGQATTEYILILLVVVMVAMKFKNLITSRVEAMVGKLGDQMDDAMSE